MKKIILLFIMFLFINDVWAYCSDNSYYIESQLTTKKRELSNLQASLSWNWWSNSSNSIASINNLQNEISYLENQLQIAKNNYQDCLIKTEKEKKLTDLFSNWYNSYNKWKYQDAINYFKQYLEVNWNLNDIDYNSAKNNLILSYKALWDSYLIKNDYDNAMLNFLEIIKIDNKNSIALWQIWICYYQKNDYDNATKYFNDWLKYSNDIKTIEWLKWWINDVSKMKQIEYEIEKNQELIRNAPTNDSLSYLQYYIKQLNIDSAWNKVKNNKEVIVAIIDDGININHPDLVNSIWTHPKAKYWDSKIIDFVWDWLPANLPVWEHWTMIAWIIWAKQNNNEWIAWISKNVKLMPLRVFDSKWWAKEENIIKAIEYAIDNWANIINLSLWLSQFYYSDKYDTVIKKAFDKWVIVVIAAWNGDILSWKNTWINLTNNPISPVCNNTWKYKYSIWVYAVNKDWYRTNWTNYWNCADFFAPWEWIISTSIPVYNSNYWDNYNMADWTSFSAPIITWIIALWYNQYGYINPSDIYDALSESYFYYKLPWWENWKMLDVSKYIDILWEKVKKQQDNKKIIDNQNKQKQKAEVAFNQIKKKFSKLSETKRKTTYNSILKQLNWFKWKVKWDKEIILNHLIFLVNVELWNDFDLWDLFGE